MYSCPRRSGTASRNCDLGANCGTCAAAAGTCGGGGVAGKCGHPPVNNDCDQAIEVAESTLLQSHSFELVCHSVLHLMYAAHSSSAVGSDAVDQ